MIQKNGDITKKSCRLSYLLRHSSLPDAYGWVNTATFIKMHGYTRQELNELVSKDAKGRFEFSENKTAVRARYRHSVEVIVDIAPNVPSGKLYHGTATQNIVQILIGGIKPGSRKFVHLSENIESATKVGSRHGIPAVFIVDTEAISATGSPFYPVKDGIWLTEYVAPGYNTRIREIT